MKKRLVAGCMTGTSLDGLDIGLVEIEGSGLMMRVKVKKCLSKPLGKLADSLRLIASRLPITAKEIARISNKLATLHLSSLMEIAGNRKLDLVSIHGQTLYHAPPLSLQMINPTPVAIGLNVPVVSDLRAADLAMGGQGAPITPISDFILYSSPNEKLYIVNLGGFCNITKLPECDRSSMDHINAKLKNISGQDVCSCNQILDAISRDLFHSPFDDKGKRALNGSVEAEPFNYLKNYLMDQSKSKRSLGTGDENDTLLLKKFGSQHSPENLARSACAAIASTIVSKTDSADRIILAGGGTKNLALVTEINDRSEIKVELSDSCGISATHREAVSMAILGTLCHDRVQITLPQVTGSKGKAISGIWVLP